MANLFPFLNFKEQIYYRNKFFQLRLSCICRGTGNVPLFLIHYVHKNAGRNSLVSAFVVAETSFRCSIPDACKIVCMLSPTNTKSDQKVAFCICRGAGNRSRTTLLFENHNNLSDCWFIQVSSS